MSTTDVGTDNTQVLYLHKTFLLGCDLSAQAQEHRKTAGRAMCMVKERQPGSSDSNAGRTGLKVLYAGFGSEGLCNTTHRQSVVFMLIQQHTIAKLQIDWHSINQSTRQGPQGILGVMTDATNSEVCFKVQQRST